MTLVNPSIFFVLNEEGVVLWDYGKNKQFVIHLSYFLRLCELSQDPHARLDLEKEIDQDLAENHVVNSEGYLDITWGWDLLSKIFHIGTSDVQYDQVPTNKHDWAMTYSALTDQLEADPIPKLRHQLNEKEPTKIAQLAVPSNSGITALQQALIGRKTVRNFSDKLITKRQLEMVLYYTLGYIESRVVDVSEHAHPELRNRRTSPSGGGLNSTEGYVYVRNVEGLIPGIYYYDSANHKLIFSSEKLPPLGRLVTGQHFSDEIPFGIFFVCQFNRLWWKYRHSRAYRVALLDVGHLSQTFQLVATSIGLATWLSAAIDESVFRESVRTDHSVIYPLLFVGAGHASGDEVPVELGTLYSKDASDE